MNLDELNERKGYWSKILRLQDYDVTVSAERHFNMKSGWRGSCAVDTAKNLADIKVLDQCDWDSAWTTDQEVTLVHELLHVKTWRLDDREEKQYVDGFEVIIHNLATALVELDRKGRHFGNKAKIS